MKDYYRILGVLDDAEDIIIRAAYKALAQRYHPDKWTGGKEQANKKMAEINEAYEMLSDPSKRKKYDEEYFRFRAKDESAEVNDDDTSFVSEEDENWQMAIEFFPKIKEEFDELSKYSKILANTFKVALISSKEFHSSKNIKLKLEEEYFKRYYGNDSFIRLYAKNLLLQNEHEAAIFLNKMVRYMGSAIGPGEVLNKIVEKFPHIKREFIINLRGYIQKLTENKITTEEISYLLRVISNEISNTLKTNHENFIFSENGLTCNFNNYQARRFILSRLFGLTII